MTQLKIRETDMPEDEAVIQLRRKLDSHIRDFEVHVIEEKQRYERQDELYERSMEAIQELSTATKDVVNAWNTANLFARFLKWVAGIIIAGGVIYAYLIERM